MRRLIGFIIFILALALAGILAFVLLPQIVSARIADSFRASGGLSFSQDGRGSLDFENGLGVSLSDVVLAASDGQSVPLMTARTLTVPNVISLFTGTSQPEISLDEAVISLEHRSEGDPPAALVSIAAPFRVNLSNTTVKLSDRQSSIVLSATDVEGQLVHNNNGELLIDARGLFNGISTQATIAIDRAAAIVSEGSPADLAFSSGGHSLTFSGRLKIGRLVQLDGVMSAQSDNLRNFLIWLGLPLMEDGRTTGFSLDSPIAVAGATTSLTAMRFDVGGLDGAGRILVRANTDKPQVTGDLSLPLLNFNLASSDPVSRPDLTTDWSERPFSFSDLFAMDGMLAINAERVLVGALQLDNASLAIEDSDGVFKATIQSADISGGKLSGTVSFAQDDTEARIESDLALRAADGQALLGDRLGIPRIAGQVDATAKFTANGGSPAALVSTLKGNATLALRQGRVAGVDLGALLGRAGSAGVDGWPADAGQQTALGDLNISAGFADGVATLAETQLPLASGPLAVTGSIDLLRRALQLAVTPAGGKPVSVSGLWDKPRFAVAGN
ncbi:MAG: AsmA family protein [Proteobacteria bacterium]|nr:AsmA family protein [Pseudomonadota bacterium]